MSNPLLDLSIAVTIAAAAVLGSLIVLPRPKPEPPSIEKVEQAEKVEKVEAPQPPTPPKTDVEQAKQIAADISDVRKDLAEIKETIRLQQALKSLPSETSGDEK